MGVRRLFGRAVLSVALVAAIGCAAYRPVDLGPRADLAIDPYSLRVGDQVEVTRLDGSRLRFAVTALSEERLEGEGVQVPATEIQAVSVRRYAIPGLERSQTRGRLGALAGAVIGVLIAAAVLL